MPEAIKIGWLGSASTVRAAATTRSTAWRSTRRVERGLLDRPYEFVLHGENGLPNGSAKNATDGFRYLVDEGCIGVAGAYSSDNAITVAPLANELQVPLISWAAPSGCRASTASGSVTATSAATPRSWSRG